MGVSNVLAVREPKQKFPDDFKKKALEQFPVAIGFASTQGDQVHVGIYTGAEYDLAQALEQIEDEYKDDRVCYHLVNAGDDEINLDSCQPFKIIEGNDGEGEDKPTFVAVIVEGEFPKYEGLNTGDDVYSPEYFFVNQFLSPLLYELWDVATGETPMEKIGSFMAILEKKTQQDKIEAELGPRATVLVIPFKGEAKAFQPAGQKGYKYSFGYTTKDLGYKEATAAAPAAAASPKLSLKKAPASSHPPGGAEMKPEEKYAGVLLHEGGIFFLSNGVLMAKPPKGSDYKDSRTWWNRHLIPPIPKDSKMLFGGVPAEANLKPTSTLRQFMNEKLGIAEPKKAVSEQAPPNDKDKKEEKEKTAPTLFIPQDQKTRWLTGKKDGKLPLATLDELKATIGEYPPANLALGENSTDLMMLSVSGLIRTGHDVGVHTLACIAHEYRLRALGLLADKKVEEKKVEEVAPPTPAATGKPRLTLKKKSA